MNNKKKKNGPKPKNLGKTLKRLLSYVGKYKLLLGLVLMFLLISSGAMISSSYFLKPVINDYVIPGNFSGLLKMMLLLGSIYGAGVLSAFLYGRIMVYVAQSAVKDIRMDLFKKMQKLPVKYFDSKNNGDLMSLYTNDIDSINEALNNSITNFISSGITFVGVIVMMLILSPVLTLITFISLGLMMCVVKAIGGRSKKYFSEQQKNIGKLNGYVEEMTEGQKVIKVFSYEENAIAEFEKINEALREASTTAQDNASRMMPIMGNMSHINYAITCCIGGVMAIAGSFDVGSLVAFLQYVRQVNQPIQQVSQQVNTILAALAGAERIFDALDEDDEIDNGTIELINESGALVWSGEDSNGSSVNIKLEGNVVFKDVVFGYNDEKTILKGISLYAKAGQKVAFVGSTGAGKTTITNLINRFYEINSGIITYDGINITDIKKDDLRKSIGIVLQDTHLFTGTIEENIRYGNLNATREEVIAASKLANAHAFIKHLPHGYDTVLTGDGDGLSQGQRQLIAIARAAVANPPVLIMDEATSSIDTRTEKLISQGMDKLMEGRTVFVIAHRLSTIKNSDVIMVLEQGDIIERGNHEELLNKKGRYYQLYTGKN